jgi:hypothetical protein
MTAKEAWTRAIQEATALARAAARREADDDWDGVDWDPGELAREASDILHALAHEIAALKMETKAPAPPKDWGEQ